MFPMMIPILIGAAKAAAVGAAVGAGGAALTGGDVKKGALIGGVTGGALGGLGSVGGASTGMAGRVGTAVSNFNTGLKSAVGIGQTPTAGAGAAGAKAGSSILGVGTSAGISRLMPQQGQPSVVTDYGTGPVPMARNQQQLTMGKGTDMVEAFKKGLV